MREREARVVENEARFRVVNERIRALVSDDASLDDPTDDMAVMCECGHDDCTETVTVPLGVYESAREAPAQFVIEPGHELPEFERIVSDGEGYAIVEKTGDAKQVAEDLDPRDQSS